MGIAHKTCLGMRPAVKKNAEKVPAPQQKQYNFPKVKTGPNYKQADPAVAYDPDIK